VTEYAARPDRVPTHEPCTIARCDGSAIQGTLLNLSNTGFCVGAKCALSEGERIEMRILGLGRLKGTVRWILKGRAGGKLDI
jgi:PilZ domain.